MRAVTLENSSQVYTSHVYPVPGGHRKAMTNQESGVGDAS
jgi:hypothetical protein